MVGAVWACGLLRSMCSRRKGDVPGDVRIHRLTRRAGIELRHDRIDPVPLGALQSEKDAGRAGQSAAQGHHRREVQHQRQRQQGEEVVSWAAKIDSMVLRAFSPRDRARPGTGTRANGAAMMPTKARLSRSTSALSVRPTNTTAARSSVMRLSVG